MVFLNIERILKGDFTMERKYLLPKDGQFYKANLHTHTVNSDGLLTPEEVKELYVKNGYSIIAYTDHNAFNWFKELDEPNKFLALAGCEVGAYTKNSYGGFEKTCHLNAIARNPENAVIFENAEEYTVECINELIKKFVDANFIVNYNHPCWSSEEPQDYLGLKNLTAMEIYNHGCEVLTNDGDCRGHYDIMLKHGMKLYCLATDDNHHHELTNKESNIPDSCGGFTMFKAPALTYDDIIKAFDAGEFYCSTGAEIHELYIEDNKLIIDCSPVKGIYVKGTGIGASFYRTSVDGDITHAEFDLTKLREGEKYIRVEIVNTEGKMAFSNPYYL